MGGRRRDLISIKANIVRGKLDCAPAGAPRKIGYGTNEYIVHCGYAGIIAAGSTHFCTTPLDVVKCRMQTNPAKYPSLGAAWRRTISEEGLRGLTRGGAPCLLGYGMKGFFKFGFYELFKMKYSQFLGEETSKKYRSLVFLAAAASAELIGDVILSPFEAVKVRIQTDPSVSRYAFCCIPVIYREKGVGGLFKGLPPLAMRQVPFTCTQLISFEFIMEFLYAKVVPKSKADYSKTEQMGWVALGSILGGIIATIASHQPDVLVSILNKNPKLTYRKALGLLAKNGIWSGLKMRLLMVSSIAALQLFIVDSLKTIWNLEGPKSK